MYKDSSDVSSKWDTWIEGFEVMLAAMGIKDNGQKRSLLMHYVGADARKLVKQLPNTGEANTCQPLVTALSNYFLPKQNRIFSFHQLLQLKQEKEETMDSYYVRVKEKVNLLKLHELTPGKTEELLALAQLVNNCHNSSLRRKAIRDGVTLEQFLSLARSQEVTDKRVDGIDSKQPWTVANVYNKGNTNRQGRSHTRKNQNRSQSRGNKNPKVQNDAQRDKSQRRPNPLEQGMANSCYRCGGPYPVSTQTRHTVSCGKCAKHLCI